MNSRTWMVLCFCATPEAEGTPSRPALFCLPPSFVHEASRPQRVGDMPERRCQFATSHAVRSLYEWSRILTRLHPSCHTRERALHCPVLTSCLYCFMFTFFAKSGRSPSQISLTLLLPSLSLDYRPSDQSAGVHAFHLPVRSNVEYGRTLGSWR